MKKQALTADSKAAENFQPDLITHNETILKLHSKETAYYAWYFTRSSLLSNSLYRKIENVINSICIECRTSASIAGISS